MATVSTGGRPREHRPCELGQRIEAMAARRGLRLDELARRAGLNLKTIYQLISGRTPDPRVSTLKAVADALGVTVDRLIAPPRRKTA